MNEKMPRTPFSTPLSRSARETQQRIQNIVTGPKKRPPILFLLLMFSVCLLCGNLVSCHVAEVENANDPEPPASSSAVQTGEGWQPVALENRIVYGSFYGSSETIYNEPRFQVLTALPADELPREAVDLYHAARQDYWRDMLLPVAYDEAADVTLYLAVDPDTMTDAEPVFSSVPAPTGVGVVLRHGDRAQFLDLSWENHQKYGINPWLAVEDFDGDGQLEIATALGWESNTGVSGECLYILEDQDLEIPSGYLFFPITDGIPDYDSLPLEIFANPEGTAAKLVSGDQELEVDLTQLGDFFSGTAAVGNVISFTCEDGQIYCKLTVGFFGLYIGYLADITFPVVYEDGEYRLGPALSMSATEY